MQSPLINGWLVFNNSTRSFIRQFKFSSHFIHQVYCSPVAVSAVYRLPIKQRKLYLDIGRTFKTMECCGNSCGIDLSKDALKKKLTSMQYLVTQEGDTERAFTGKYYNHFEKGIYNCIVCNQELFSSEAKFDSKCGWPAFSDVVDSNNVKFKVDLSHVSCNLLLLTMKTDMKRTEVTCSKCGAHLGHVFDDGPKPTGKRYCINSAALDFRKAEETGDSASKS